LYLGPSHSTDGIFVYFPEEKFLYGGCILVEDVGIGYLGDSNLIQYPKTLSRLKNLNLEITNIITGHGDPVHGPELLNRYMTAMQEHINKNF
jgi:metallo-beta-lactamase class B